MVKKILTIDGGGIKGVFPASFLAELEDATGKRISKHFDLIVGTSTGGIIALALGMGMSAGEILKFYETHGPKIFAGNRWLRKVRHFTRAKYNSTSLKNALEETFGDRLLGNSTNRLVIPGTNLESGKVHVFKTSHHPRLERDYLVKVVDVALATSAAPTYFKTHQMGNGLALVDGGIWANNPTGMAVVEAIGVLGWPRESIQVLSIGCTSEPLSIGLGTKLALGLGYWALRITNLFMTTQSFASWDTARILIGDENVLRVDPVVANGRFALDSVSEISALKGMGKSVAREQLPTVRKFFEEEVEAFVPFNKLTA